VKLEVTYSYKEGWNIDTAYIIAGDVRFGLNPNAPNDIRIFDNKGGFQDYDLDQLRTIHSRLVNPLLYEVK
jgi:hypothetical protein